MTDTRNILITGGTDGIGLKLAHAFADDGAKVVITGRRNARAVSDTLPATIAYIEADQTIPAVAVQNIVNGLEQLGWNHCDLAILNAGNGKFFNPFDETADNLRRQLDVNLTAPILIAHGLSGLLMAANSGKLVVIGSTSHTGAENFASYAASKSGLNGFVRSLREEWRGKINVQIIHPGPIATNMHAKAGFDPGLIKKIFLSPDFITRSIIRKIKMGKSPVNLSFLARILDYLTLQNWSPK